MELKHIKDLMASMGKTGTKRLRLKKDDYELELEREDEQVERIVQSFSGSHEAAQKAPEARAAKSRAADIPASLHPPLEHQEAPSKVEEGKYITSPMVGTFYATPGPDEPPFVKIGEKVSKDTVVCIVEAMKVMNEVKAGAEGTLAEVLVDSGHPVEFGTKLFRIT